MILAGVDPGLRVGGLAAGNEREILFACLLRGSSTALGPPAWYRIAEDAATQWTLGALGTIDRLAIETMFVYPASQQKGGTSGQNDLIQVAGSSGAICALLPARERLQLYPRDWKGTLEGDAMIARIKRILSPAETHRVPNLPANVQHNVWDAIGIVLFLQGRLQGKRVISRFPGVL